MNDGGVDGRRAGPGATEAERPDGMGRALVAIFAFVLGGALFMAGLGYLMFSGAFGGSGSPFLAVVLLALATSLLVPAGLSLRGGGRGRP